LIVGHTLTVGRPALRRHSAGQCRATPIGTFVPKEELSNFHRPAHGSSARFTTTGREANQRRAEHTAPRRVNLAPLSAQLSAITEQFHEIVNVNQATVFSLFHSPNPGTRATIDGADTPPVSACGDPLRPPRSSPWRGGLSISVAFRRATR
jgi:hypothetical protein